MICRTACWSLKGKPSSIESREFKAKVKSSISKPKTKNQKYVSSSLTNFVRKVSRTESLKSKVKSGKHKVESQKQSADS